MKSLPRWLRSLAAFGFFLMITLAAAAVGAAASQASPQMYAIMAKPSWAPPAWLFGPVWSILYLMMTVAAWRVWRSGAKNHGALWLYGIHLIFQALWSWLFFGIGRADFAMLDIVVLWLMIAVLIRQFGRCDRSARMLLIPYALWVSFAALLNGALWWLNGGTLPR
ncbi:MAG: tryptophan-rich sensory protein [Verrucomicrobia bacterium]|nr:MAG: tryptophan-rich sensory protein [Verrucomicrobiota bacterium]